MLDKLKIVCLNIKNYQDLQKILNVALNKQIDQENNNLIAKGLQITQMNLMKLKNYLGIPIYLELKKKNIMIYQISMISL